MASREEARSIIQSFVNHFGLDQWHHYPEYDNIERYLVEHYEETPCGCNIWEHCSKCCNCEAHTIDPFPPF